MTCRWDGNESLSRTIVDAIAAVSEQDRTDVEASIHTAIDPETVEQLFESLRKSAHRMGMDVSSSRVTGTGSRRWQVVGLQSVKMGRACHLVRYRTRRSSRVHSHA
ncbi:HalOD1 output domain-containing protein [Haladaptatus sp. W1]|uniref:HalOD1 output domain-containing protein n=1 Tax=Haladaptatus sp. W1 TaxID=1897478 RepID=UPI001585F9D9